MLFSRLGRGCWSAPGVVWKEAAVARSNTARGAIAIEYVLTLVLLLLGLSALATAFTQQTDQRYQERSKQLDISNVQPMSTIVP